jgi:hypothetical protein
METHGGFNALVKKASKELGRAGLGTTGRKAKTAIRKLEDFGLYGVGFNSKDEEIANWVDELWEDQDNLLVERQKEWLRNIHYVGGSQHISWHKVHKRFIPVRSAPWRIKSVYNISQKFVDFRVARLTENKPMITVQGATTSKGDIEKAEFKEMLFWYLWNELDIHELVVRTRRWAAKCGAGYLRIGWNPDAGPGEPATIFRQEVRTERLPVMGPDGQPQPGPDGEIVYQERELTEIVEYFVDQEEKRLGRVMELERDPLSGEMVETRLDPPEATAYVHEGQATIDVRSSFNIRYDIYAPRIEDSWYVQDSEILPATKILAIWPDAIDKLEEAEEASEDDRLRLHQEGLTLHDRGAPTFTRPRSQPGSKRRGDDDTGRLNREFTVRQTLVLPKDDLQKRLWGEHGALIVTVGGVLIHKSAAPEYAMLECPYLEVLDGIEEGNHYGKSKLRDIIPLQDDINRMRSHKAESIALRSRFLLWGPDQSGINFKAIGAMPGVFVTTRSKDFKPEVLDLGRGSSEVDEFYNQSLEAVADLGDMQDASRGRLPAAGVSAKLIYALQYADERGIAEVSNLQDKALARLARALDAVTRTMYTEGRKIMIAGEDQSFLVEQEIDPVKLNAQVDYHFTPGSMLAKQKEAVKNEMLTLLEAGLVEPHIVRRHLSTAVPDVFRVSYDLQYAHARRQLKKILSGEARQLAPEPWDDNAVHKAVIEEFMLTARWEVLNERERGAVIQLWQAHVQAIQLEQQKQAMMQAQMAQQQSGLGGAPQVPGQQQIGAPQNGVPQQGAQGVEQRAEQAMRPPSGFEQLGQPA